MTYHVKIGGAWKTITNNYVKISGTWRTITNMWVKIAGVWRPLFSSTANQPSIEQTVTLTTNSSTMPATLTGRNYHWTNATTLTYKFQYYNGSQWLDGNGSNATGTISNPSSGSSSPKLYDPITADFPSGVNSTVSFRFVVTATNTNVSPSLQTISTSNTVDIDNITVYPNPSQTLEPGTPTGTGQAFTLVNKGSSGTYTNMASKTTSLVYLTKTTNPTSGSTTAQGTAIDNSLLPSSITQVQATTPQQSFYTRDNVVGLNGTTYYYYSSPLTAYVAAVSDTFNRTAVPSGLGTSTSSFIYSSYANLASSWSTDGSSARNSTAVSFSASGTGYPLQTIEVGTTDRSYALASFDGNSGGVGVAYWVTSAGSWWATIPSYYYSSTTTTTPCSSGYGTFSSPSSCGGCGYTTSSQTSSSCSGSATTNYCPSPTSGSGGRCTACTTLTNYYQTCPPATASSPRVTDNTIYTGCNQQCSVFGPLTETTYGCTTTKNYSTLTACLNDPITSTYNASTVGSRCGSCSQPIGGVNLFVAPAVGSTSTTYYTGTTRSCSDGYSYGTIVESTSTVYSCYTGSTSSTTTTYYSRLKVYSSVSGSVSAVSWTSLNPNGTVNSDGIVATSTSGYNKIYSHTTTTSGDLITAIAYDSSGTQMGSTLSLTASSPTKANANGETSVGLIKGPTDAENGSNYSDWQVSG